MPMSLTVNELRAEMQVGSKAWMKSIRKEARDLAIRVNTSYMDLARVLYEIYDRPVDNQPDKGPLFKYWGYATFDSYVEEELGLHPKTAQRLRKTWFRIEIELKLDQDTRNRLINLGFAKARELARVITRENVDEWIRRAEELSHTRLVEAVQQYLVALEDAQGEGKKEGDVGLPNVEPLYSENFKLYPEQSNNVKRALERAKQISNSEKKGHNLDLISTYFLATNDFTNRGPEEVKSILASMENSLGLLLVACDPKTGDIIHGFDTLKQLADWGE